MGRKEGGENIERKLRYNKGQLVKSVHSKPSYRLTFKAELLLRNGKLPIIERNLIVGIDPGTTTAVALLDLEGNLILTESRKNFSVSGISKFILEQGKPVVIAADTHNVPKFIEKVAANFYARAMFPECQMERKEKNSLVEEYLKKMGMNGHKFPNRHEKDALAAAVYAFRRLNPLFNRIEQEIGKMDYMLLENVKADVILKKKSIKSVLKGLNQ